MKSIIVFRHGKSDWDAAFGSDHERPINKRGKRDSAKMGRFLAEADQLPDRIVTSSAVRARETLERAAKAGGWRDVSTLVTDDLYEATPDAVMSVIQTQENGWSRLLLIGHEPTWSQLIGLMIGGASIKVTTAMMVRVDFQAPEWKHVDFGGGTLRWAVPPKTFG